MTNVETDWAPEDTEAAAGGSGTTQHLWEESWDDDDTSDDFSAQLKYGTPGWEKDLANKEMLTNRAGRN